MLDRFEMKDRLKEAGSTLMAITPAAIEEVDPTQAEVAAVRD